LEKIRPIPFLRNFQIVDTPGINSILDHHQALTEEIIPLADVVIFVFSVTNPWGAAAWNFLDLIHQSWLKNLVFVIQQADLREPIEIDIVAQYLEKTAVQRLGQSIPVFAVSAKKAILAKTTGLDKERLFKECHYGPLESHLSLLATHSQNQNGKLQSSCSTAQILLTKIGKQLQQASVLIKEDKQQLHAIEEIATSRQHHSLSQIDPFLQRLEKAFDETLTKGETELIEHLNLSSALDLAFGRITWMKSFQEHLETHLFATLKSIVEPILETLGEDLKQVHLQFKKILSGGFQTQPPGGSRGIPSFEEDRAGLLARIEGTLQDNIATDRIEQYLESCLKDTITWTRVPLGLVTAGGVATGFAAALTSIAITGIIGAITASTTLAGTLVALSKREKMLEIYREQMQIKRNELSSALRVHFQQAIENYYHHAIQAFRPLKTFYNSEQERLAPLADRQKQLEITFSRLASSLKA